jgi:hypothetical protein
VDELHPGLYETLVTQGLRQQLDDLADRLPVDRRRLRSGFSTAYVGSSNLTHSAQVTGLEWNVQVSAARNAGVVEKFTAVFDSYWSGGDFVPFDGGQFDDEQRRAGRTDRGPQVILSPIELRPFPFQERLLELVELARQQGHHRNLLVAATAPARPSSPRSTTPGCEARCAARACSSSPTVRRSSTGAWRPSATPSVSPPSARSGWAVCTRPASSTCSPRSRASSARPATSAPWLPTTSTW